MILLKVEEEALRRWLTALFEQFSLPLCGPGEESGARVILSSAPTGGLIVQGGFDAAVMPVSLPVKAGAILDKIRPLLLGRYQLTTQDISFSGFTLRPRALELANTKSGTEVKVTEKECEILQFLLSLHGGAAARETLLKAVWGYADGIETHTLETHIYRLRQKLEEDPSSPRVLVTDEDGYRLVL